MKKLYVSLVVFAAGVLGGVVFAVKFPAVEGLGTKVRLPVYHGAMTWATLVVFALLAVASAWFLVRKTELSWKWATALRVAVVSFWTIGTVLGFVAAFNTWDFTASSTAPLEIMLGDPRLIVQIVVTLLGWITLLLPLVADSRAIRAVGDIVLTAVSFSALAWAMNAGKALHPDSPVMNSEEILIKLIFFAIVACHLVAVAGLSATIVALQGPRTNMKEIKNA